MNAGKRIEVDIDDRLRVSVRDYGRGIPQGKLVESESLMTYRLRHRPTGQGGARHCRV